MAHYTNHSISIQDNADSSAVIIGSLTNVSAPNQQDIQYSETGGTYYPEHVSVASISPRSSFTSFDLPKLINKLGLIGATLTEGVGKPGFAIYQAKYNNSVISAGSTHRRLRYALSYAKINRLSVSHRQDANVECEAMAIYDESSAPVLIETSQALPTLPSSPGRWTIGPATINSVPVNCITDLEVDFGVNATLFGCDSDIYDTHLNLDSIQPKIRFTVLDPEMFGSSTVPLIGLASTHANCSIVLRKRLASQAGFVANATAEHIEITANGTLQVTEAHGASGNQRAQTTLELSCTWDGTNAPVIFDTAYAIP